MGDGYAEGIAQGGDLDVGVGVRAVYFICFPEDSPVFALLPEQYRMEKSFHGIPEAAAFLGGAALPPHDGATASGTAPESSPATAFAVLPAQRIAVVNCLDYYRRAPRSEKAPDAALLQQLMLLQDANKDMAIRLLMPEDKNTDQDLLIELMSHEFYDFWFLSSLSRTRLAEVLETQRDFRAMEAYLATLPPPALPQAQDGHMAALRRLLKGSTYLEHALDKWVEWDAGQWFGRRKKDGAGQGPQAPFIDEAQYSQPMGCAGYSQPLDDDPYGTLADDGPSLGGFAYGSRIDEGLPHGGPIQGGWLHDDPLHGGWLQSDTAGSGALCDAFASASPLHDDPVRGGSPSGNQMPAAPPDGAASRRDAPEVWQGHEEIELAQDNPKAGWLPPGLFKLAREKLSGRKPQKGGRQVYAFPSSATALFYSEEDCLLPYALACLTAVHLASSGRKTLLLELPGSGSRLAEALGLRHPEKNLHSALRSFACGDTFGFPLYCFNGPSLAGDAGATDRTALSKRLPQSLYFLPDNHTEEKLYAHWEGFSASLVHWAVLEERYAYIIYVGFGGNGDLCWKKGLVCGHKIIVFSPWPSGFNEASGLDHVWHKGCVPAFDGSWGMQYIQKEVNAMHLREYLAVPGEIKEDFIRMAAFERGGGSFSPESLHCLQAICGLLSPEQR